MYDVLDNLLGVTCPRGIIMFSFKGKDIISTVIWPVK